MKKTKQIDELASAYARSVTDDHSLQLKFKLAYLKGYTQSWIDSSAIKINPAT